MSDDLAGVDPQRAQQAAETATALSANNKFVQVALSVMVCSRNLYAQASSQLNQALIEGNIPDASLVSETLQASVAARVENNPMDPEVLRRDLVNVVLPYTDILVQRKADLEAAQEAAADATAEAEPEAASEAVAEPPAEAEPSAEASDEPETPTEDESNDA